MNKEQLLQFAQQNKDNFSIQLKRHHPITYAEIANSVQLPTFGEKLYRFIYGESFGMCEVCGNRCKFDGFHKGYRKRCSYKCSGEYKKETIKKICPTCKVQFSTDNRHNRITCSVKCQLEYVKTNEVKARQQENTRLAMLAKYGVEYSTQLPDFVEKSKQTKLEKYGNENYVNPDKAKHTKLEKYGDENYNNHEKFKETFITKYGADNPSKVEPILDKVKATKIEHFGGSGVSPLVLSKLKERLASGSVGFGSEIFNKTMVDSYGNINGSRVPTISAQMIKTTHDKFYYSLISGSRLGEEVVPAFSREEYVGTRGPNDERIFYKFSCVKCTNQFEALIEDGNIPECPLCHPVENTLSRPENEVAEFVQSILPNVEIIRNTRSIISPMELDIYIPSKQLAIEFDGMIWHAENFGGKKKHYHITKTNACNKHGIRLIHVFENEWTNKQDIVKRKISLALGLVHAEIPQEKIFARKCVIKEIDSAISSAFLTKWHIQGKDNSSIRLGAYYNNTLVANMTFGKKRIAMGSKKAIIGEYEMYRFCVGDSVVIGVAGKLLTAFIKKYDPNSILTFADIRYSGLSAFYEKIGFSYFGTTSPNYWYFHKSNPYDLKHRFSFRKNVLSKKLSNFNPELSEWENMKLHGYDRIWDCGNLKYVWSKPIVT